MRGLRFVQIFLPEVEIHQNGFLDASEAEDPNVGVQDERVVVEVLQE
jgi:hypothetical protein